MRILKTLIITFTLLAGIIWVGVWFSTPRTSGASAFTVAPGEGTATIIDHLKEQGIIRSELLFKLSLKSSGLAAKLQPGTYDLRNTHDFTSLIEMLTTGGVPENEFTLLIREGENLADIKKSLADAGFSGVDLYRVTGIPATDHRTLSADTAPKPQDFSADFAFLQDKPSYVSIEGFLFPDTYRFFRDATTEEVVRKLLGHFDEKLTPALRADIAKQKRTVYDVITLASVVEMEVRSMEDRRIVADIFWRRLEEGMPLQSDATVNYATGKSLPAVTLEDTKNVSPYNTYKYRGLPLGPISNPGASAIEATVHPTPNAYVYFLTDPAGKVYYGRTLDEHNRNKAKYLK